MAGLWVLGLFVILAIAMPLVLYGLVRSEHDDRETMGRSSAQRAARRDTHDRDLP